MSTTATTPEVKKKSFAHRLYVGDFAFEFIKNRKTFYIISAIVLTISVLSVGVRGLNFGIEFKGGSVFQAPVTVTETTIDDFKAAVSASGVDSLDANVRTVGTSTVRVQTRSLETDEVAKVRQAIADQAGVSSDDVAYSLIGPSWGKQITQKMLIALVVFLVMVGILIWIYFHNAKMSLAALLALMHDLVVTIGLYALVGFSVTPATVIAVLTILGYSLYDTVVVFDMVREQTHDITKQNRTYNEALNQAINQVLVRSINTTIIAVLPVSAILIAAIVVLGGQGALADLGLAMLIGMLAGAYSSICIATPLLATMRKNEPELVAHEKTIARQRARKARRHDEAEDVMEAALAPSAVTAAGSVAVVDVEPVSPPPGERRQPRKSSRAQRKK